MRFLFLFFAAVGMGHGPRAFAVKEYYSLSRTPRAQAMGNAFYGLSDDEGALFYNPAGLALMGRSQFLPLTLGAGVSSDVPSASSELSAAFRGTSDASTLVSRLGELQGKFLSATAGVFPHYARRGFAIGLLVGEAKSNLAFTGREIDSELDVTGIVDSGLFIGKAWSLGKGPVHLGITGKLLVRAGGRKTMTLLDFVQSTPVRASDLGGVGAGVDFDVGFLWTSKNGSGLGLSFNNILATAFPWARSGGLPPPQLTRMVSLGGFATTGNFVWRADLSEFDLGGQSDPELGKRSGSLFKHVNLGVEWKISGGFQLRAGVHQGSPSAGIGIALPFMLLDFATYGEELGLNPGTLSSRRYGLRLAFGYAGSVSKKTSN